MAGSPFSMYYKCSWSHELHNWVSLIIWGAVLHILESCIIISGGKNCCCIAKVLWILIPGCLTGRTLINSECHQAEKAFCFFLGTPLINFSKFPKMSEQNQAFLIWCLTQLIFVSEYMGLYYQYEDFFKKLLTYLYRKNALRKFKQYKKSIRLVI